MALAAGLGTHATEHPVHRSHQMPMGGSDQRPAKVEYRCYAGDLQNYPSPAEWLSWDMLWDLNREQILSSNRGDTYLQHYVQESILQVARDADVDPRFILAVVMQESKGFADTECVGTTPRCGIMHAPKGSRFDQSDARFSVERMIRDGVQGTAKRGPGLADLLKGRPRLANVPSGNWYALARAYNSGAVGKYLDVVSRGQPGYVNDIANRLQGWNGLWTGHKTCG